VQRRSFTAARRRAGPKAKAVAGADKDFLWKRIARRMQANAEGNGSGKMRRAMGQRTLLLLARGRYHSQDTCPNGFGQVAPCGDDLGQVVRHFGRARRFRRRAETALKGRVRRAVSLEFHKSYGKASPLS